jgi:hypothetical protein
MLFFDHSDDDTAAGPVCAVALPERSPVHLERHWRIVPVSSGHIRTNVREWVLPRLLHNGVHCNRHAMYACQESRGTVCVCEQGMHRGVAVIVLFSHHVCCHNYWLAAWLVLVHSRNKFRAFRYFSSTKQPDICTLVFLTCAVWATNHACRQPQRLCW